MRQYENDRSSPPTASAPDDRITRRRLLGGAVVAGTAAALPRLAFGAAVAPERMRFGLVTYLWGQDWPLDVLLANCESTGVRGVELRTEHAHGVDPEIDQATRSEVRSRLADSPVECVGLGSNEQFDSPDAAKLRRSIDRAKEFLQLSHDIGAGGVKVKPNSFHKSVPREKTEEQIGRSLNELARFAADMGQELRLEVHGGCAELPTIQRIIQHADHPNARICWNCNPEDLRGAGLEQNFHLVRDYFGATLHVREVNIGDYPYAELARLLVATDYRGWVLLEARTRPADRVAALSEQRRLWSEMVAAAAGSRRHAAQANALH